MSPNIGLCDSVFFGGWFLHWLSANQTTKDNRAALAAQD